MGRGGGWAEKAVKRGWEAEQEGPGGSAEVEAVRGGAGSTP